MTGETYWRTAAHPQGMLHALLSGGLPTPTRRQLRLIGVAAADRTAFLLPRAARHLFRFAEQFAERESDRHPVEQIAGRYRDLDLPHWATPLLSVMVDDSLDAVNYLPWLDEVFRQVAGVLGDDGPTQADILRDVLGNPYRPPPAFVPGWRTAAALGLARSAFAGRRWDRLPLLADALEEAGCDAPDLLDHCRSPGPHVRGCWAVDQVLGRR